MAQVAADDAVTAMTGNQKGPQGVIRDPLHDATPNYRLPGHRGEHDERLCPACGQPLDFLHYDHAEIHGGGLIGGAMVSSTELVILLALITGGITAMMAFGTVPGIVILMLGVPLALRWQRRREIDRAVWRCAPCDAYFTGERLVRWKAP